jgi:N utilization substance protein B
LTTKKTTTSADSAAQARANARSARRRAREFALQGVYAWLLRGGEGTQDAGEIDAHLRDTEDFSEADAQWFKTLLHGVLREAPALRERFTPYVDRPLAELSPVEHGILLIGSFELIHHVEVPYKVAINEAVELAKSFGGTDGFKFVNGVLDKLAADDRAHDDNTRQHPLPPHALRAAPPGGRRCGPAEPDPRGPDLGGTCFLPREEWVGVSS